jgi:hypothetical protein
VPASTWDREALRALRAAIAQRDLVTIEALCADRNRDEVLQLAGEVLPPERALARAFAAALRRRGYRGDAELADVLEGRSELRPVSIDLEVLSSILGGDPVNGGGRVDLATGEIWPGSTYEEEDDDDPDRWLWVEAGSGGGWTDMADFTETVTDPTLAARLERAIHRKGAFRAFRDELSEHPDEHTRFHQFSTERALGRAREARRARRAAELGSRSRDR